MTFENGLPHSLSLYIYILKNSLQMIYFYSLVNCVWHLFMLAAGSIMHGNLRLLDMYQTAVEKMHGGRVFLMWLQIFSGFLIYFLDWMEKP